MNCHFVTSSISSAHRLFSYFNSIKYVTYKTCEIEFWSKYLKENDAKWLNLCLLTCKTFNLSYLCIFFISFNMKPDRQFLVKLQPAMMHSMITSQNKLLNSDHLCLDTRNILAGNIICQLQ